MKLKDLLIVLIVIQTLIGVFYLYSSFEFYSYLITSFRFDFQYFSQIFNAGLGLVSTFLGIIGLSLFFANNSRLNRVLKLFLINHTFNVISYLPLRITYFFFNQGERITMEWHHHVLYVISVALVIISILYYSSEKKITVLPVPVNSRGPRFLNYLVDYFYIVFTSYGSVSFFINANGMYADRYPYLVFAVIWALILPFIYYTVMESAYQQTLGKVITNTFVRSNNRERAGLGKIMVRSICRYIPFEPFSYLPTPMSKWHDKFSETDVFYASKVQFEADPLIDHLVTNEEYGK